MPKAALEPLSRIVNATRYSLNGWRAGWRTQPALRYECYALLPIVPLAWHLGTNGVERALLIGSWLLVIVVELINSAIESVVDRIGSECNELSRRAKDLGSAAVLSAIVLAATVWSILAFRRFG